MMNLAGNLTENLTKHKNRQISLQIVSTTFIEIFAKTQKIDFVYKS